MNLIFNILLFSFLGAQNFVSLDFEAGRRGKEYRVWVYFDKKKQANKDDSKVYYQESEILTGDENIVSLLFSVQYSIENNFNYLININDSDKLLRNLTESI